MKTALARTLGLLIFLTVIGVAIGWKLLQRPPKIVAYENQLLEFAAAHPELVEPVRQRLRILYPRPTIWASHPLIALNAKGQRLIAALRDPQIQRLAWERHGFRSGVMGTAKVGHLPIAGVPPTIDAVIQMPSLAVWTMLTDALQAQPR